jgi:hypothetical protein
MCARTIKYGRNDEFRGERWLPRCADVTRKWLNWHIRPYTGGWVSIQPPST